MKTFVLCAQGDKPVALDVLKLLKTLGIQATAFALRDDWTDAPRRMDEILASATHVVVVYTERAASSGWLAFAAGYALGAERPLVLLRAGAQAPAKAFLSPFFLLRSIEDLSAFLEAERREWTAVADRREARRELLDLGVSFRAEAFADSVREGNAHAVDLFIRAGFPADTRDKKGVPVLCVAAREKNRAILDLLLDNGASVDLQSEDRGNSALMDAAAGGALELVDDLLAAGAATDLQSKDGQTALVIAVGKGDAACASRLVAAGADPDVPDKLGLSARKYAKLFNKPDLVALLG